MDAQAVDCLCEELFLKTRARDCDENLIFVRERLLRSDVDRAALLSLYEQVRDRQPVRDDETNPLVQALRMAGIVRVEENRLVVRNRIYQRVFDSEWIHRALRTSRAAAPEKSIAVLPLLSLTTVQEHEYLCDGLTEELIHALGCLPGLRVASRTSAFQLRGWTGDLREAGSKLNVQFILEGGVRWSANAAQISVRLVSVTDGQCVWADTFRCPMEQFNETQAEIARGIARRLQPAGTSERTAGRRRIAQPEVVALYLKGRFFWNKRTEAAVRRSISLYEEAIQKDPDYAPAYAGLADAYSILGIYNYAQPRQVYPKVRDAATRALELDGQLPQGHCAFGCVSAVHDWNWWRAEDEFRRAIELNSSYATAHQWLAVNCLAPLGRGEEALRELRQAQEVDPLSISIAASAGLVLYLAGRYDEAIIGCRETIELDPHFWLAHLFLGWACLEAGAPDEAIAALQASIACGGGDPVPLAAFGYAQARLGRRPEALRVLEQLRELTQSRYVPAMEFVLIHTALGDLDAAADWMATALSERSFKLIYLRVDPKLEPLREHARFADWLRQVRLDRDVADE